MPPTLSLLTVTLHLEQANAIIDEALRLARQHDMLPLTAIVLDAGGHQIALKREDGSGIIRVQIANAKAYGSLGMGVSSRVIGDRLAARPVFATALSVIAEGRFEWDERVVFLHSGGTPALFAYRTVFENPDP